MRELLSRAGDHRKVDALVNAGLLEQRGDEFCVRRRERLPDDPAAAKAVAAAFSSTLHTQNWYDRLDQLSDVEYALMLAGQEVEALHALLEVLPYWAGPLGEPYVDATLRDFDIRTLQSSLNRTSWMRLREPLTQGSRSERTGFAQYSGTVVVSGASAMSTERLRRAYDQVRSSIADEVSKVDTNDASALTRWMTAAEELEPGISWEYAAASLRRTVDGDRGERQRLLALVSVALDFIDLDDLSTSPQPSVVVLDDLSRLLLESDDDDEVKDALALVEVVTRQCLVNVATPIQAQRHMAHRARIALATEQLESASVYAYEAFVSACLSGDQARHWSTVFFVLNTPCEYELEDGLQEHLLTWADRWLRAARDSSAPADNPSLDDLLIRIDDVLRGLGLTFTRRIATGGA